MKRSHVVAALLVGSLAMACGLPRSPDSEESRCAQGFAMLEAEHCHGNVRGKNPAFARYALEELGKQCKDAESVARAQKFKTTCITAQETAVRELKDDRRKIRARYIQQVSELLLDPAYGPLVDRYKDQEERAFHHDARAKQEAQVTLAELAALVAKHGIDPTFGKELQLW